MYQSIQKFILANLTQIDPLMQPTLRSISIRKQILGKLKLNQIEGNPICPVNKAYKLKPSKLSKRVPTIEEQIFSTTSIKLIKPYSTQKLINLDSTEYSLCSVLRSPSYHKLQKKLTEMMSSFSREKKRLTKEIRNINSEIEQETEKSAQLCTRLMKLDDSYDRLENEYYEIRRENYELKAELNQRRQGQTILHLGLSMEPFNNHRLIDLDQMSYEQILEMEDRLGRCHVGLDTERIAKLTVSKLKELHHTQNSLCKKQQTNCCICCDSIQEDDNVIQLQCEHVHHASCIKEWLRIKKFCPLCKSEVALG